VERHERHTREVASGDPFGPAGRAPHAAPIGGALPPQVAEGQLHGADGLQRLCPDGDTGEMTAEAVVRRFPLPHLAAWKRVHPCVEAVLVLVSPSCEVTS